MEQIQNNLRAISGAKAKLSAARAGEKAAQHPQMMNSTEIVPTEVQVTRGGNMDARMKRVIGAGRKGKGKLTIHHGDESESEGEMEGCGSNGKMVGCGKSEGEALAKHLKALHGAGFLSDFIDGFKRVVGPIANVAAFLPGPIGIAGKVASGVLGMGMEDCAVKKGRGRPRKILGAAGGGTASAPPMGRQVVHNVASSQLGPNVLPARAYGNTPQAPASFANNTVGMGMSHRMPDGSMMAGPPCKKARGGAMCGGKKTRAPSARGAMVSKLMKGEGMSLGEASKYIKEHPECLK